VNDDRPVALAGSKQRAALGILLLSANRVVSIERFADDLYAGEPPVTAVTQVQRQVSELRKLLGAEKIETRSPGYVLHVEPECLDLVRFERWTSEATQALGRSDAQAAVELVERALALWRGAPVADLTYESFAQPAIARLQELRLAALELRFDGMLALGGHTRALPELEALVWEHPLRERLRGQLMLALYRSGRQAEALEAYRKTRDTLVGEFGIEPTASLRELEHRILTQDASLDAAGGSPPEPRADRSVLVLPASDARIDALLSVVRPLGALPGHALILARLVDDERELESAAAAVNARRALLGDSLRTAAFTSIEPARDVVRLTANNDVELVVVDAPVEPPGYLFGLTERGGADLAAFSGSALDWGQGAGVFVPFGGGKHDWAALELGAWLASATRARLTLVGTSADPARGRRDASRLLADASLAVQRVVGVAAEPMLAEASEESLRAVIEPATLVVLGLPARAQEKGGLGGIYLGLVRGGSPPVLLVHRGTRPGGLAPRESQTRFSWSLEP